MSTLVVIAYRRTDLIGDCVSSLGTDDCTRLLISTNGKRAEVLAPGIVHGVVAPGLAAAWNQGIEYAVENGMDYVCFMHDDVRALTPDLIVRLRLGFAAISECGATVPGSMTGGLSEIRPRSAPCFMLSKEAIMHTGRFDARFVLRPELEYLKRMATGHLKTVAVDAKITHLKGGTTGKVYNTAQYATLLNKEMELIKSMGM